MKNYLIIAMTLSALIALFSAFGFTLCRKLKIDKIWFYFPVGYAVFLGVYECLMILPLKYCWPTKINYIVTGILLLILVINLIINFKFIFKVISKDKFIPMLTIGFIVLFMMLSGEVLDNFDDHFYYFSFVSSNLSSTNLNMVDPNTGGAGMMQTAYQMQGIYFFQSAITYFTKLPSYLIASNVFTSLTVILNASMCFNLIKYFMPRIKTWVACLLVVLIVARGINVSLQFLGNSMKASIYALFVMLMLIRYQEKKNIWLILLFVLASCISCQSSVLFMILPAMFAMIIYDCVKKDKDSLFYSILIACPLLVYMILYLGLPNVILIGFTIGIILLIVIYNWIHSFWAKAALPFAKFVCLLFVLAVYAGSVYLVTKKVDTPFGFMDFFEKVLFPYDSKSFLYHFSLSGLIDWIYNIVRFFAIVMVLLFARKKDYYYFVMLSTVLIFFNPVTIPFVSKYMTDVVYSRFGEFLFSTLTIIYILANVDVIKGVKSLIIIYFGYKLIASQTTVLNLKLNNFNYFYHMSDDAAEIAFVLEERAAALQNNQDLLPFFATDFRFFLTSDRLYQLFSVNQWRYYYSGGQENFGDRNFLSLYNVAKKSKYFNDENAYDVIDVVLPIYRIQFIVIDKEQLLPLYERFEKYCEIKKENNSYILYECHYE